MAYDVFVVSALEDRDMANLVVRRLRALKFRCWFDKKQTDNTFDPKDARNALNSQSMLVLWSENAVKSDWVRAAASVGNSRPGMLVEVALDDVIPYQPFSINKRYSLEGMTTRTTVEGFYEVIEELGRRDGRKDLRDWLMLGKNDASEKLSWLENHPSDPLAIAEKKKREKELGIKPEPSEEAAGAAALAASTMKAGSGGGGATDASRGQGPAERAPTTNAKPAAAAAATGVASSSLSAGDDVIGSGYGEGVGKVPGTPGAPYKPGRKGPAGVYASSPETGAAEPKKAAPVESAGFGRWMVPGILAAIALMFLFGWAVRTTPASTTKISSNAINLVASSEIAASCPAGYISSSSLASLPDTNPKEAEDE